LRIQRLLRPPKNISRMLSSLVRSSTKQHLFRCSLRGLSTAVGGNLDATEWAGRDSRKHVIAALVLNEAGVLAGVSNMFAARNYNIDSLVVGRTEIEDLSRMTITVIGDDKVITQVQKQLEDLVPVVVAERLTYDADHASSFVQRDFMLIKVKTLNGGDRGQLLQLVALFDGKVVDISDTKLMVELSGVPSKLQRFTELCEPYGIIELSRTGVVAMQRGDKGLSNMIQDGELVQRIDFQKEEIAEKDLPPG